jgi:hypothetical protein
LQHSWGQLSEIGCRPHRPVMSSPRLSHGPRPFC